MIEKQLFNLNKIKEITLPIQELEGKIQLSKEFYKKFIEIKAIVTKQFEKSELEQLINATNLLNELKESLIKISNENVNKFLIFQDLLIRKYKDSYIENLMSLKLDRDAIRNIGLSLIEKKHISKIIDQPSYIKSLAVNQYIDILDSLIQNSLFISTVKKMNIFYRALIQDKLKEELRLIPVDIDPELIKIFKKKYLETPLSFDEFLKNIEKKLTKDELEEKRIIIQKTKEREKLKRLKKEQEEQFKTQEKQFEDYFKLSDREFQRVLRKRKREKLSDLLAKPSKQKEITEEVSEKIEKFKSKVSFEEKYLIQRDDEKDPIEVIRERKKKKDEEYRGFIKKFEDKE